MKTGRTVPATLGVLQEQNRMKRDYIVPTAKLRMLEDGQTLEMGYGTGLRRMAATRLAHRQAAAATGIPQRYYDRMQEEKPWLLAENVNSWLADRDSSFMLRTLVTESGQTARAILSDRYRRIDNLDIALATLPLFAGQEQYEVVSCEVTENYFYIKILNHRLETAVVPGDYVQAGVCIRNSEVGLGAVTVQPLLYRLVCSNGMILNDLAERKTHIGRLVKAEEEGYGIYQDDTIEADNNAFLLRLRDVTLAAIEETRFMRAVDRLRESVGAPITGRVQDVVELTGKNYGLTQNEQDGMLKYLIEGGSLSLYGLSNAITRMSQDVESYDRATELESVGWQVATMPAEQWRAVNR